jgi:hypothetical protein
MKNAAAPLATVLTRARLEAARGQWQDCGMKNPHLGQRVCADGLTGTFTVVRINTYQGTADLELTTGTHKVEMHIPFTAIHPVGYDRGTGASSESAGSAD